MRIIHVTIGLLFNHLVFSQDAEPSAALPDPGPILEPDPVRFSFDAPGWYVLGGLLIIFLVVMFFKWLKHYRENAYRRDALKKLGIMEDVSSRESNESYLNDILILLKLVALKTYGRQEVAILFGKEWFAYLEAKGNDTPFSQYENMITSTIYECKPIEDNKLKELSALSKKWIKTHA